MKWLAVIAAVVIVAVVMIYRVAYPSATVRYRLSIEAQVNEQPLIASGVSEIMFARKPPLFAASASIVSEMRGEAVSVRYDKSALLVVLLRGESPKTEPAYVIPILFGLTSGGIEPEDISRLSALTGERDVPVELLPPLVRFRDANDPASVEIVDAPSRSSGSIKIKRASIEIVDAGPWPLRSFGFAGVPLSHTLESNLPWLSDGSGVNRFWRALHAAGFRTNSSVEPLSLLKRGL